MANANTVYRAKKAAQLAAPTSASTFVTSDSSSVAAAVYFPIVPSNSGARMFRIRASGYATTTGSNNVTPILQLGTSVTSASNTTFAAGTARAVATTTGVWYLEATLVYNPTSTLLKGHFTCLNGSTAVLDAQAVTTSVTADLSVAGVGVTCACTVATGGTANLTELCLEVL